MTQMMIFAYAVLGIGSILAAVFRLTVHTRRGWTALLCAEAAMVLAGGCCLAASLVMASAPGEGRADQLSWAADAYLLWLRLGGISGAAVGGILFCSSLIRHRMERTRVLAGGIASVVMLLFGFSYGVICIGEAVDPSVWVWLSALGFTGLMRLFALADAAFALFCPKSVQKNRKMR